MDNDDLGLADGTRDRRNISDKVEFEISIQGGVDRGRCGDHEQRVAVSGRSDDRFSAEIAASTRPVFNDKRLAQSLRQPLPYYPTNNVGQIASGRTDDDAHRS